jgi:hypothetical protein
VELRQDYLTLVEVWRHHFLETGRGDKFPGIIIFLEDMPIASNTKRNVPSVDSFKKFSTIFKRAKKEMGGDAKLLFIFIISLCYDCGKLNISQLHAKEDFSRKINFDLYESDLFLNKVPKYLQEAKNDISLAIALYSLDQIIIYVASNDGKPGFTDRCYTYLPMLASITRECIKQYPHIISYSNLLDIHSGQTTENESKKQRLTIAGIEISPDLLDKKNTRDVMLTSLNTLAKDIHQNLRTSYNLFFQILSLKFSLP